MTMSGWTTCCVVAAAGAVPLSAQETRGSAGGPQDRPAAVTEQRGEAAPPSFFQPPPRTAWGWASSSGGEPFSGAQALNARPSLAELRAAAGLYDSNLPVDRRARDIRDRIVPPGDRERIAEPAPTDQFTITPEPSTMVLLGTALIALAAATIVRRARANRLAPVEPPQ